MVHLIVTCFSILGQLLIIVWVLGSLVLFGTLVGSCLVWGFPEGHRTRRGALASLLLYCMFWPIILILKPQRFHKASS